MVLGFVWFCLIFLVSLWSYWWEWKHRRGYYWNFETTVPISTRARFWQSCKTVVRERPADCWRGRKCPRKPSGFTNSSARLEGLLPALTDFHTYDYFVEVFHTIFLLFGVILIHYYGNNTMSEIDITQKV